MTEKQNLRYYHADMSSIQSLRFALMDVANGFPTRGFDTYSKSEQKKIIAAVNDFIKYREEGWIRPDVFKSLTDMLNLPQVAFEHLRAVISSLFDKFLTLSQAQQREWEAFANRFGEEVAEVLNKRSDPDFPNLPTVVKVKKTGEILLSIGFCGSFSRDILLKNAVLSEDFKDKGQFELSFLQVDVTKDGYCISGLSYDEKVVAIDFSDVEISTQLINCFSFSGYWYDIGSMLGEIDCKREDLGEWALNEREKALLPLVHFYVISGIYDDQGYADFEFDTQKLTKAVELFCEYAKLADCEKLVTLCKRYLEVSESERDGAYKQLKKAFLNDDYHTVLHFILEDLRESQVSYPTLVELNAPPQMREQTREVVTKILNERGFEGDYPSFRKIYSKRSKVYTVQCVETGYFDYDNYEYAEEPSEKYDRVVVNFAVSAVPVKGKDLSGDYLESAEFFAQKIRRSIEVFTIAGSSCDKDEWEFSYDFDTLERSVATAAKVAEKEKLTKAEKDSVSIIPRAKNVGIFSGFFWLAAIVAVLGAIGGVIIAAALFLIALIIEVISAIFSEEYTILVTIEELLYDFPFFSVFLDSAWIGAVICVIVVFGAIVFDYFNGRFRNK